MKVIQKIGLAVFKDKNVLMVKSDTSGDAYYFLGGTVEQGETDFQCLEREVQEEVGVKVLSSSVKFLKEFSAPAHNRKNAVVVMRLYVGKLIGEPKPYSEVLEIRYFDSSIEQKYQATLTRVVFPWLKEQKYIN